MARSLAVTCLLAAVVAGCFGGAGPKEGAEGPSDGDAPDGPGPQGTDGPRSSVQAGGAGQWNATGCSSRIFEARMPAELLRPHLPERFELYEFPPGVSYAQAYVFACDGALLGNATATDGLRQVLFSITFLPASGRAYFVVDWVASDPVAQAALAAQGFSVALGDVSFEGGSPQRAHVAAGAQDKATITWVGEGDDDATATTTRFVQDLAGTDLVFEAHTPGPFLSGGFNDVCLVEPLDPAWQAVLKAARDCLPFQTPDGDVTFQLPAASSPDASR